MISVHDPVEQLRPIPIRRTPHYDASELPNIPAENLGRLSAEAVQADYEAASKSVELMGEEVQTRIRKLEGALADCDACMNTLKEAAAAIREKGALAYAQIEESATLCTEIRDTCEALKRKLGA